MRLKNKLICVMSSAALCFSVSLTAFAANATINATAGKGGSISPQYNVHVNDGEDMTFNITPDEGYKVYKITVDGRELDDVEDMKSYTFYSLNDDHTINVQFKKVTTKYTSKTETGYTKVVATREENNTDDGSAWTTKGDATKARNEANKDKKFYITPSAGYGGSVLPNSRTSAMGGESLTFTATPNAGYIIKGIYIDELYCGKRDSYTFSDIAKDHTIRFEFEKAGNEAINKVNSSINTNKSTSSLSKANVNFNVKNVENPFNDIKPSDTYYNSILNVYNNNVLLGTAANEFSPNAALTRQEAAKAFFGIERIISAKFSNPYSDVAEDSTYRDAIAWAYHTNIIKTDSNTFNPNGSVTKEELCAMIYNYALYTGAGPKGAWRVKIDYHDADQISPENTDAIIYCAVNGIAVKDSNGGFNPKKTLTRAEAADILNRAMIITRQLSGKKQ